MTPKQQVKQFLKKLKSPYWTPLPTSRYLTNWQGNVASFNMYYVLSGRPSTQKAGDLKRNIGYWRCAKAVVDMATQFGPIGDTVVVLTPCEFWQQVIKIQPFKFTTFLPLNDWQRLLLDDNQDSTPAAIRAPFTISN